MSLYTLIIVTFVIFMAINVIIGLRGRKHASKGTKSTDSVTQYGPGFCRYNGYPRCLCQ